MVSEGRKSFPLLSSALLNQSSERPTSFRSNQDATGVSSSLKKYQNHYETSNSRARGSSGSSESQDHLCLWASAFFPRAFYGCHHVDPDVTPAPPLVFTHPDRRQQLPHTRHESTWQRTVREREMKSSHGDDRNKPQIMLQVFLLSPPPKPFVILHPSNPRGHKNHV